MLLEDNKIDKTVPIPLYFQLKELILKEIKNENYISGSMIPTENEISEAFMLSRTTVRQAITELVKEGWLYRIKSKGTFVAYKKIEQDFMQKLEAFENQIDRLGRRPRTEVLRFEKRPATKEVSKKLQIPEKSQVIYLYRKRFADDVPIVLVETYLPADLCEYLLSHDMQAESLYFNLNQKEITRISKITRTIEAVEADSTDATLLNYKKGRPIQFFESIGTNSYGRPVEYSIARYRGDYNKFEVTITAE